MIHKLKFHTQHHQFYLTSDDGKGLDSDWDDQASEDRLAILENALVVFTECYGPIKGRIDLLNHPSSAQDFKKFDHIVEGGMKIHSGILRVLDCPNSGLQFEVKLDPGNYRVRVYSSNLASVEGDEGDDYYKIEMWPSDDMERRVLKRYERENPDESEITPKPDSLK